MVPGTNHAIAVFSATAIQANGDRLIAWMRDIVALKRSEYVPAIGRFSDPPQLADLAALVLDDRDIDDVKGCRPARCGIKLAPIEIEQLQRAGQLSGAAGRRAVDEAFRRVVFRRVETYLASGQPALPAYEDHGGFVSLQARFSALLEQSPFIRRRRPDIALALDQWPRAAAPQTESFLYWSKEQFGAKPMISVTHVMLLRQPEGSTLPEAVVIAKQVFATHYTDGSLSVTAVICDRAIPQQRYLAYLNRSDVDVLDGFWGGLVRRVLEHRLRSDAPAMLATLRHRLESGDPPRSSQ
jgi:hypothetical protein